LGSRAGSEFRRREEPEGETGREAAAVGRGDAARVSFVDMITAGRGCEQARNGFPASGYQEERLNRGELTKDFGTRSTWEAPTW
jgi:hypothetical protein